MKIPKLLLQVLGIMLIPLVWIVLKNIFQVSDRYLPSLSSVIDAFVAIKPNILVHSAWSLLRLLIGFSGGVLIGLFMGLIIYKKSALYLLLYPTLQSIRSVPAPATIPFFLLWFGFAETGKFLLVFLGIAFNLSITVLEILNRIPEKYTIMFRSYGSIPQAHIKSFALPFVMEKLLPTLRFSLATSIGLVVVSEFLGSQVGLGYLIETARSTFSMNVIFAAVIIFGLINFITDRLLIFCWKKIIYWNV